MVQNIWKHSAPCINGPFSQCFHLISNHSVTIHQCLFQPMTPYSANQYFSSMTQFCQCPTQSITPIHQCPIFEWPIQPKAPFINDSFTNDSFSHDSFSQWPQFTNHPNHKLWSIQLHINWSRKYTHPSAVTCTWGSCCMLCYGSEVSVSLRLLSKLNIWHYAFRSDNWQTWIMIWDVNSNNTCTLAADFFLSSHRYYPVQFALCSIACYSCWYEAIF